ncbi:MAG: hypothetical protein ABI707_13715 [Ferruginibacter sp.]
MKYSIISTIIAAFCLFGFKVNAQAEQEKLDLPGDNLNLYSVLKLFQESETLEGFEKNLNDETSKINNLDLDGDNNIDYISVADNLEGTLHNITLKVAVNKDESQDVAVFVVQKDKDGRVQIQVIGDEDLYGKDYIIEPNFETAADVSGSTPNPGYMGNTNPANDNTGVQNTTTAEIAAWPVISFIYVPDYVNWHSPWHWNNYPTYWRPWRPSYWHYYYGYQYHWNYYYNAHYRRWHNYRAPGWHNQYYGSGYRSRSAFVQARYTLGDYSRTYTRPELAIKGSERFRRDNPKAPSANDQLPSFDKTGRPIVSSPVATKPVSRPATARPDTTKPGKDPVSTRPTVTEPVATSLPVNRPVTNRHDTTKPVKNSVDTRPAITEPVVTSPPLTKPVTAGPGVTAPVITRPPVTKPVTARPDVTAPVINRPPVTKPLITKPAVTVPVITRPPVTKPVTANPAVTRPVITRLPATKPVSPNPAVARPVITRSPVTKPLPQKSIKPEKD